jgi:hypothetical protein
MSNVRTHNIKKFLFELTKMKVAAFGFSIKCVLPGWENYTQQNTKFVQALPPLMNVHKRALLADLQCFGR